MDMGVLAGFQGDVAIFVMGALAFFAPVTYNITAWMAWDIWLCVHLLVASAGAKALERETDREMIFGKMFDDVDAITR